MNRNFRIGLAFLLSLACITLAGCTAKVSAALTLDEALESIHWLGQASVKINADGKIIYIDPLYTVKGDKADIILITHAHSDHYSFSKLADLMKKDTVVIAPFDLGVKNRVLKNGESTLVQGFRIEAVPAYNAVNTANHPKTDGNNGYVVTVGGIRIYHAGDTELIPEMKSFSCDIAMVPIGRVFTFRSIDDAVQAVLDVQAKAAIPIHWGMNEGSKTEALVFAEKLAASGVRVDVRDKE